MASVFSGIRVVELGSSLAAAIAGQYLADNGAWVLKVEEPGGDARRAESSFHAYNRGKSSMPADLVLERESIRSEIANTDVVLVGLTAARARALGFDEQTIRTARPDVVYVAITPAGSEGPYADVEGDEAFADAINGLSGTQAGFEGPPIFFTLPVAAHAAGLEAAGAVAVGLMLRLRTGRGIGIETSMVAGGLTMFPEGLVNVDGKNSMAEFDVDKFPLGNFPVFRVYRASDGYLALACGNEQFWYRLCLTIGRPEFIGDPRLEGAPWAIGAEGRRYLQDELERTFATRPHDEWIALLRAADVPVAPTLEGEHFLQTEQVMANGMRIEVVDEALGSTEQVGPPIRFERTPAAVARGAPAPGQRSEPPAPAVRPTPSGALPPHPLESVRIVNLAGYIAGAYAPTLLADLGAEVIKVESRDGDPFRPLGWSFATFNRGQRVMVLDLKHPEAREIVLDLVRDADVVVENYRPGTAKRLGLDYETLSATNPRLVYLSAYAYGSRGRRAGDPGFDTLLQAESGVMQAQGGRGAAPVYYTSAVCDYTTAALGAAGVMFALFERESSGSGQHIEVTLMNAGLALQTGNLVLSAMTSAVNRGGRDLRGISPLYRYYRCADGWLFLDARGPASYTALQDVLAAAAYPDHASATAQPVDGPLATSIAAAVAEQATDPLAASLRAAGIVAVKAISAAAALASPQIVANGLAETHQHALWGDMMMPFGMPRFAGMPSIVRRPAPMTAEHTTEILRERGLSDAAITNLLARGVAVQGTIEEERSRIVLS